MEADERVEALHHEADSNTEEGMEFRVKGFSPRALRQDFTIDALLSRLWKARRTMAVANSDASSLLGGWSFRKDNLSRSLSHFVSLWDGALYQNSSKWGIYATNDRVLRQTAEFWHNQFTDVSIPWGLMV